YHVRLCRPAGNGSPDLAVPDPSASRLLVGPGVLLTGEIPRGTARAANLVRVPAVRSRPARVHWQPHGPGRCDPGARITRAAISADPRYARSSRAAGAREPVPGRQPPDACPRGVAASVYAGSLHPIPSRITSMILAASESLSTPSIHDTTRLLRPAQRL